MLVVAHQGNGKWHVTKMLAQPSPPMSPELRAKAAGPDPPSNHHGPQLAAVVVAFILARRAVGAARSQFTLPLASLTNAAQESSRSSANLPQKALDASTGANTGRGDQTQFANSAEAIVSEARGIPRNEQGPGEQRIKVPDLGVAEFQI